MMLLPTSIFSLRSPHHQTLSIYVSGNQIPSGSVGSILSNSNNFLSLNERMVSRSLVLRRCRRHTGNRIQIQIQQMQDAGKHDRSVGLVGRVGRSGWLVGSVVQVDWSGLVSRSPVGSLTLTNFSYLAKTKSRSALAREIQVSMSNQFICVVVDKTKGHFQISAKPHFLHFFSIRLTRSKITLKT